MALLRTVKGIINNVFILLMYIYSGFINPIRIYPFIPCGRGKLRGRCEWIVWIVINFQELFFFFVAFLYPIHILHTNRHHFTRGVHVFIYVFLSLTMFVERVEYVCNKVFSCIIIHINQKTVWLVFTPQTFAFFYCSACVWCAFTFCFALFVYA